MLSKSIKFSAIAIAVSSLLTACGGGGGGSAGFTSKNVTGVAVDFYIAGAKVEFTNSACAKLNANVITNENGEFNFKTSEECQKSGFTITGGKDTVTGADFIGTLKIKERDIQNNTKLVASPLTTLEAELKAEEFTKVLAQLGFSASDVTTFDPVKEGTPEQLANVYVLQQILNEGVEPTAIVSALQAKDANLATVINTVFENNEKKREALSTINTLMQTLAADTAKANLKDKTPAEINQILIDAIKDDKTLLGNIQNYHEVTAYNDITYAGYTLAALEASSRATPVVVDYANFVIPDNYTISTTTNADIDEEIVQLGLRITDESSNEQMSLYISKAILSKSKEQVTLPKGAVIEISTTLKNAQTASLVAAEAKIASAPKGQLSVEKIIEQLPTDIQNAYTTYKPYIDNRTVKTESYLATTNYPIAASLGLGHKAFIINNQEKFKGALLTAHFKPTSAKAN